MIYLAWFLGKGTKDQNKPHRIVKISSTENVPKKVYQTTEKGSEASSGIKLNLMASTGSIIFYTDRLTVIVYVFSADTVKYAFNKFIISFTCHHQFYTCI